MKINFSSVNIIINKLLTAVLLSAAFSLDLFGANLSSSGAGTPMPLPNATIVKTTSIPNEYIKLNLNHITQERNLCVPTCASMMLAKFGWNYPPRQLKLMTVNKPYYGPRTPFSDFTTMKFVDLIKALQAKAKINWHERLYSGTNQGFQAGLNDIKVSLRKGYPVMIGLDVTKEGHAVVVCGVDERNKRLIVNDPSLKSPGVKTLNYSDLQNTYWSNRTFKSTMRSAVFMY
jgi:hypothetical protein